MAHWKSTLKVWAYILVAFLMGHTLDLVYRNTSSLSENNQTLSQTISTDTSKCEIEKAELRIAGATDKSRADTLSKQNIDQQSTINNCQTQAIKLLTPTPEIVIGVPLMEASGAQPIAITLYAVVTNKVVSRVALNITCDLPIEIKSSEYFPRTDFGVKYPPEKISPRSSTLYIDAPAWTPDHAIVMQIGHATGTNITCKFKELE